MDEMKRVAEHARSRNAGRTHLDFSRPKQGPFRASLLEKQVKDILLRAVNDRPVACTRQGSAPRRVIRR